MAEEQVAFDEAVETRDDESGVPEGSVGGEPESGSDGYTELQERMAGDDNPWFSDSEGAVVDKDGAVLTDPKTGNPFKSQEEFDAWVKQQQDEHRAKQQETTAKPKTDEVAKPLSKNFDFFVGGEAGLTPEKIQQLAQAGTSYKYADELVPKVEEANGNAQQEQPIDPIEKLKAERKNWEAVAVEPVNEIRQLLLNQGADATAVEELLGPVLKRQLDLVETQYKQDYEKAMIEKLDGKYSPTISKFETEKLTQASNSNIERLAKQYYPEGGKDAFFALVNGHYDEKGNFTRGPAAIVVDFATTLAADGKVYNSQQERADAYANTFRSLTADPAKAAALADIAHYYWLGKQAINASKLGYQKGLQVAKQDNQRIQKTIRTRPASFQAPSTESDDEGMPNTLRLAMGANRR